MLLAMILLVILGLAVTAVLRYLRVEEIRLPDLAGMPYAEAAALLRNQNLVPVSYPENVQGVPVEVVTSQTPPAGSVVRQGRNVAIGVNRPPEASRAPVLVGLLADQAISTARAVNLRLESVDYAHSSQPAGRVIEQQPEPGERVGPEEGVTIVVSRGPRLAQIAMPDLVGVPVERARRQLLEMGLRSVQVMASGVSFEAPGMVASQDPPAGSEIAISTPVLLGYRLSAREVVPVPDVVGRNAELAERMLRAAGLQVGEVQYLEDPATPSGTVVQASPSSYTLRGSPVVLTLNARQGSFDDLGAEDPFDFGFGSNDREDDFGPGGLDREGSDDRTRTADDREELASDGGEIPVSGRRVSVTFDPANLGVRSLLERDYDLRLVVQDDNGERTVIDRRVGAGESVSAVVLVEGDAMLQTYINGVFFQAWRP